MIYIAGPFRPKRPNDCWEMENNIRRAEALALEVWRLGHAALCPHSNTRFFQNVLPDEMWLEGDLAMLSRCDAVLLTEDWQLSAGARAEVKFAESRGIPVLVSLEELKMWLREGSADGADGADGEAA